MEIAEHIVGLLMLHNEVSIPEVGIIKARYKNATVHPTQHTFSPPSKIFSFEKNIAADNSLLISTVEQKENCSYEIASSMISKYVAEIKQSLNGKGAFIISGIGRFYFDIEKKLLFTPLTDRNYLAASFGLPEFISPPVLRPENILSYAAVSTKKEKKKRKINWFRF